MTILLLRLLLTLPEAKGIISSTMPKRTESSLKNNIEATQALVNFLIKEGKMSKWGIKKSFDPQLSWQTVDAWSKGQWGASKRHLHRLIEIRDKITKESEQDLPSKDVRVGHPKLHIYPKEKIAFLMTQATLAEIAFRDYHRDACEYEKTKNRSEKNLIYSRWKDLKYWATPAAQEIIEKARRVFKYSEQTDDVHIFDFFARAYVSMLKIMQDAKLPAT